MAEKQRSTGKPRTGIRRRLRHILSTLAALTGLLIIGITGMILITGWRAIFPAKQTSDQRLRAFPAQPPPVQAAIRISWDDHQIPFVEAQSDQDAAFALGMVHAHLREGQMAVLKRAAQGRLSEMAGPLTVEIDRAIRTLGLGYAADSMIARLDPNTRLWLESFVNGVNFYTDHSVKRPPEFGLLGIEREPFTLRDLMTISRLAGGRCQLVCGLSPASQPPGVELAGALAAGY